MKHYAQEDTIAAVATPPGEGGIAVIRLSGREALAIAAKVFSGPVHSYLTHTAHVGRIMNAEGEVIDEVLLLVMHGPRSYTGEDTVEIHCHGGHLVTRRVLETVLEAGARAAQSGEFTFRAFSNGKLDLAQAEAVQELIHAKNTLALSFSKRQLEGVLSQKIEQLQKELLDSAAILEAFVDFPEEGLEFTSVEEMIRTLEATREKMTRLARTFHEGKILKEGLRLCLAGTPNVGKSSLMNALLGKDRAIVTDIPGTTRDVLEEEVLLAGLHFRLLDTAGVRDTGEQIEREGIRRTRRALEEADLILLVLDAERGACAETQALIASLPLDKTIFVWNKIDLAPCPSDRFAPAVEVSATQRLGLDALKEAIHRMIWKNGPPSQEEAIITTMRHKEALTQAISACDTLIQGLREGVSAEFLSSDMRRVLVELGSIVGGNVTEDILSAIFSKFCVGK